MGSSLRSAVYLNIDGIVSDINYLSNTLHRTAHDLTEAGVFGFGERVIIRDADFSFANLENANLSYYTFINVSFKGANLKGADFSDTYFEGYTDFRYTNLGHTNFYYADAKYFTDFSDANLSYSNLEHMHLDPEKHSITGANLYEATLPERGFDTYYRSLGAVFQDPSIPEPSTYTVIFGGLSLGFILIRRKKILILEIPKLIDKADTQAELSFINMIHSGLPSADKIILFKLKPPVSLQVLPKVN